jgi:hypothetical protein
MMMSSVPPVKPKIKGTTHLASNPVWIALEPRQTAWKAPFRVGPTFARILFPPLGAQARIPLEWAEPLAYRAANEAGGASRARRGLAALADRRRCGS